MIKITRIIDVIVVTENVFLIILITVRVEIVLNILS